MAVYDDGFGPQDGASRAGSYVNYAGAVVSLGLIIGIGVWGYQLIMRDVSGIPVVRAMEGEMRSLPENPGGAVALHTGLAVNEVAALGGAGALEDRLVLAPQTPGLMPEDLDVQPMAEAGEVTPDASAALAPAAVSAQDVTDALAAVDVAPAVAVNRTAPAVRPVLRPAAMRAAAAAPAAPAAAAPATEVAISTQDFPAGTNLVQLGAFQSPALAAQEWERLSSRFGGLLGRHERVIQVSSQSSGTWYRLRASGFADRADARRLCAALVAEGADCIAVVVN